MSEPDRGLIVELREACRERDGAQSDYDKYITNYKVELSEKKEVLSKAKRRVQEIEAELVDPSKSRQPLFTAAAGRKGRQSATTVSSFAEEPKAKLSEPQPKSKTDRPDRREIMISADEGAHIEWTPAEIDECVEDACHPSSMDGAQADWQRLRETGCDNLKILEVLRAIWPAWEVYNKPLPPRKFGYVTYGGAVPKLWIERNGPSFVKRPSPTLSGLQLADRIRTVLDLPRVPVPAAEPQSATKRRKTVNP